MLSMVATFLYFMVVVGSTVAILRNSALSSSSKMSAQRSAKETLIQEWILNNIDHSVDPCEDFYRYACGNGLSKNSRSLDIVTTSLKKKNLKSILFTQPAVFVYNFACQLQLTSSAALPKLILDTITKIENSNDVSSIMAILGTLVREAGIQSILQNVQFSPLLLKNGKFYTHLYFDIGFDLQRSETNSNFKTYVDGSIVKNKILSDEEVAQIPSMIRRESLLKKNVDNIEMRYEREETSHRTMADLMNRYPNTIGPLLRNLFPGKSMNELFVHHEVNEDSFVVMDQFLTTASLSTVKGVFKYAIVHAVEEMQPRSHTNTLGIEKFCKYETLELFKDVINEEYKKGYIKSEAFSAAKTIADSILEEAKLTLNKEDSLLDECTRKVFAKKIKSIKSLIGSREVPYTQKKKELKDPTYIGKKLELYGINLCQKLDSVGTQRNLEDFKLKDFKNFGMYGNIYNEVTISSGKLQFPMFHVDYPLAVQYGLLGSTFAHEFTHSIDPSMIVFTRKGHFKEKWYSNQKSKVDFDQRAKCYVKFYSKLQITNDEGKLVGNVNGETTLGESIAESGLQLAYSAFMKTENTEDILGFTAEKLFFLSYAQKYCKPLPSNGKIEAKKTSKHHFSKECVNGNLMLDTNFANVFQCSATSTMNPKEKCNWWGNH